MSNRTKNILTGVAVIVYVVLTVAAGTWLDAHGRVNWFGRWF